MNEIHGLKNDAEFIQFVQGWADQQPLGNSYRPSSIVETGTNDGTGSTTILAKTKLDVLTIEINPVLVNAARINLRPYPNVHVLQGCSISNVKSVIENFSTEKIPKEVVRDIEDDQEARAFYLRETQFQVPIEGLLERSIFNPEQQLVFLDSAGCLGWAEFEVFMANPWRHRKTLVLDDVNHVKHWKSMQTLKMLKVPIHVGSSGRWLWAERF